jgi:hypothetical protein
MYYISRLCAISADINHLILAGELVTRIRIDTTWCHRRISKDHHKACQDQRRGTRGICRSFAVCSREHSMVVMKRARTAKQQHLGLTVQI